MAGTRARTVILCPVPSAEGIGAALREMPLKAGVRESKTGNVHQIRIPVNPNSREHAEG
jgi:hypothetical protein